MIIKVNNTDVEVTHEVKLDPATHQTHIHVSATVGGITHTHVITVGAADEPIPSDYNLQRDLDAARQKCAVMAESKSRAQKLASALR